MTIGVDDPVDTGVVTLRDGRRLGWSAWGPPDGHVVLLSPGAGTGRCLGMASGVPDRAGVRLVSHDRPGFGASDPVDPRTLDGLGADIGDLCRALRLGAPAMVANSQGAPFALAAAAAGVVSSVDLVAPADEVAHPEVAALLPPDHRRLVDLVATAPAEARALFASFDAAALRSMVLTSSPAADRTVYESPGFARAWRRATEEAFVRGSDHYAGDTLLAMAPWDIDPGALPVPVTIWFGSDDEVHSPDLGATLAARLHARRIVVAQAAGALLWTHGHLVLDDRLARRGG